EQHGIWLTVPRDVLGRDAAAVADVAATIEGAVGIHDLLVVPGARHPHTVAAAHDGSEAAHAQHEVGRITRETAEGEETLLRVVTVHPAKAHIVAVELVEGRLDTIPLVEVTDERVEPAMVRALVEQPPVERSIVVPLARLPELSAHEEEFLPGIGPHEGVQGA